MPVKAPLDIILSTVRTVHIFAAATDRGQGRRIVRRHGDCVFKPFIFNGHSPATTCYHYVQRFMTRVMAMTACYHYLSRITCWENGDWRKDHNWYETKCSVSTIDQSINQSICLYVCLSVCLPVRSPILWRRTQRSSVCLFVYTYVCLHPTRPFIRLY